MQKIVNCPNCGNIIARDFIGEEVKVRCSCCRRLFIITKDGQAQEIKTH